MHLVGEASGNKDVCHNDNSVINYNSVSNNVNESGEDDLPLS